MAAQTILHPFKGINFTAENERRFWSHVDRKGDDECWPWLGYVSSAGYGHFRAGNKNLSVHRVSWQLAHPDECIAGFYACHHCDNPVCVNPAHIYRGTNAENQKDSVARGRHERPIDRMQRCGILDSWKSNIRKSNRAMKSKLNAEQVIEIKRRMSSGHRGEGMKLAKEYGVSFSIIYRIARRGHWTDAT